MSMGKHRVINNRRSALEADQEKRGGRVLKAFRRVEQDDADLIGGAIMELAADNAIPPVRPINRGYRTFIFDPRLMGKGVNENLIAGIRIGQFLARLEHDEKISEEGFSAPLGEIILLPKNRTTVLIRLDCERLRLEREGVYRLLGASGVKGFTAQGNRSGHRPDIPTLAIATFQQPVARVDESELLTAIDTILEVQLGGASTPEVRLGELEVKSYQHR